MMDCLVKLNMTLIWLIKKIVKQILEVKIVILRGEKFRKIILFSE